MFRYRTTVHSRRACHGEAEGNRLVGGAPSHHVGMTKPDDHDPPVIRRRFGFHNLRNDMTAAELHHAHSLMAIERPAAYGTSENGHRDAAEHVSPAYQTLQGPRGFRGGTAIHYRTDTLELRQWGNPILHLSRLFPSARRAFTWARFHDKGTGRRLTFVCVHLVPHADDEQDPGDITDLPRGDLVRRSLRILAAFALACRGQLVIVGDFNIDLRADLAHRDLDGLVETFRRAGLEPVQAVTGQAIVTTHGKHERGPAYDQVWIRWPKSRRRRTLRPVRLAVIGHSGSDHAGLVLEAVSTVRGWLS